MICPSCGKETTADVAVCTHCGEPVPASQEAIPQPIASEAPEQLLSQLNRSQDIIAGCLYLAVALCLLIFPFIGLPVLPISMNLIDFTSMFGDVLVSGEVEMLVLYLPWITVLIAAVSGLLCFAKPSSLTLRHFRSRMAITPVLGCLFTLFLIYTVTELIPQLGLWLALFLSAGAYGVSWRNNRLARKALKLLKQQG